MKQVLLEEEAIKYSRMVERNKIESDKTYTRLDIYEAYKQGSEDTIKKQWVNIKVNPDWVPVSYDKMLAETVTGDFELVYYSHQDKMYKRVYDDLEVEGIIKLLVI